MLSRKKILVFLLSILLFLSIILPSSTIFGANIDTGNIQDIYINDNRYYGLGDVCNTTNGTWVIVYSNGTANPAGHTSDSMIIERKISSDWGQTWGERVEVRDSPYGQTADVEMIRCPNGNLICTYKQDNEADRGGWSISYDDGENWEYKGIIDGDNGRIYSPSGLNVVDGVVYAPCYQLIPNAGKNCSLWKSTDNGTSWSLHSWVSEVQEANDEWDFIAINSTYWIACFRDWNGTGDPVVGDTMNSYWAETFDAGVTWTNFTNRNQEFGGAVHCCDLSWLNEEQGVILLSGRLFNETSNVFSIKYWISTDNCQTWTNETTIQAGVVEPKNPSRLDGGYPGVVEHSNSAFLVYHYGLRFGSPTPNIYGVWIYDNTSYNDTNPYFLDINEESNDSQLTTGTRWGNATLYTSSDYTGSATFLNVNSYNIHISNDTAFASPFGNITGINSTYAGTYTEGDTSFYFKLADTIEGYGGATGIHYYRIRARIRLRTT